MEDWAISSQNGVYDELAYTIGFFLGDGSLCNAPFVSSNNGKTYFHNDVVFTCSDLEPVERVRDQIEKVFGKRMPMQTRILPSGLPHYVSTCHRREAFDFFSVNTEWRSKIPTYYFSADRKIQQEVLSGLMDTDGHCAEFKDGTVKRWQLGFSNTKRTLIEDAAGLFQKAGVRIGKITEAIKKGYRPSYIIHPNARDFHTTGMLFHASRKQAAFNRYVAHVVGSETTMVAPSTQGDGIVQQDMKIS